jgi:IS5 family transposase
VEAYVNDSMSPKWFLGMAVDGTAPDHSTLTTFKGPIEKYGKEALLEKLLEDVLMMAMSNWPVFNTIPWRI